MKVVKITRGLDIPICGKPTQVISETKQTRSVAILGSDYVGMKPQLAVSIGDYVRLGQLLFIDKKMPSIRFVSPGAGKVVLINRGERRRLESVVIKLDGSDEINFPSYSESEIGALDRKSVVNQLLESGLWTSIRTRPLNKVADPGSEPHSLFITAMDTNPLAPSVEKILEGNKNQFINGLTVLSRLTRGKVFLCKVQGSTIPEPQLESLISVEFAGPHPAGNTGTHIHFLDPVCKNKQVWNINAQDVIAVGILFNTGRLYFERVISLAGPSVKNPRLVRTRIGTSVEDVIADELYEGEHRIISGSVLSGHAAAGSTAFLGRYHHQISVVPEARRRKPFEWLQPGFNLYSIRNIVSSRFCPKKEFALDTSMHGRMHAIYPLGNYEKIMPLNIMPTFLLRALAINDIEEAENLGCLELVEEDLSLCSFVCPSKIDHGMNLRRNLQIIEKEG